MISKKICVIGAGPSGLTSIKQCLDEGFEVCCYEKADRIGGLWCYRDDDVAGLPSVAKSTIINTSKEMTAFSDFPPPAEYPNFMDNKLMLKYLESYANHHHLEANIKFRHEVMNVCYSEDHSETGKWLVQVRNLWTDEVTERIFDGVMYCGGHHSIPDMPKFPQQSEFKGTIMHTHSYKKPVGMDDKVVVVVGCGNSALDAAVELAGVASQVYLSTRSGTWVVSRIGFFGKPIDFSLTSRLKNFISSFTPFNIRCAITESVCNFRFNHENYGLKPNYRLASRHITINDALPSCIISGKVRVRKNIDRFTANGVFFEGENKETKCDVVVFGTGYKIEFPCLDESLIPLQDNKVRLYKSVFNPNLQQPHTLAFISIVQPTGSVIPIGEMQARWFAQLMKGEEAVSFILCTSNLFSGNVKLPSAAEMNQNIDEELKSFRNSFAGTGRHTTFVSYGEYMEEIAAKIGVRPNVSWYFFNDLRLWRKLWSGPLLAYHYRLEGPHAWQGARYAIMAAEERIAKALQA